MAKGGPRLTSALRVMSIENGRSTNLLFTSSRRGHVGVTPDKGDHVPNSFTVPEKLATFDLFRNEMRPDQTRPDQRGFCNRGAGLVAEPSDVDRWINFIVTYKSDERFLKRRMGWEVGGGRWG